MKRIIRTLAVMALALGLVAPPASADPGIDTAVIEFQGTATVCAQDNNPTVNGTAPGCPFTKKDGSQTGRNGLYAPGTFKGAPTNTNKYEQRTGNYKFASNPGACRSVGRFGAKECEISALGKLAPVAGVGAACGISHGHSGNGFLNDLTNGSVYTLSNVGWPSSAGGTLPITGTYTLKTVGTDKGKTNGKDGKRIGPISGVVQAQGGANCVKLPGQPQYGASQFTVVGVVNAL